MAASEENVINFLEDLYEKAYPAAQAEWKEMEDFAAQNLGLVHLKNGTRPLCPKSLGNLIWSWTNSNLSPTFHWKWQKQVFLILQINYMGCV